MWDSETENIISCLLIDEEGKNQKKKKKKRKRLWVHNICKKRTDSGGHHSLFPDYIEDYVKFLQYFHMTQEEFTVLIDLLKPDISGENR